MIICSAANDNVTLFEPEEDNMTEDPVAQVLADP